MNNQWVLRLSDEIGSQGILTHRAIENDIEQEFALRLLRRHRLLTSPPLYLEQWPWPVRIYSFGTLRVTVEGNPIEQSGKSQKKILELLETLVILGGRNISCEQLAEKLWPRADGDLAMQSLETALHRLRKLIGKKAVLLNFGTVSLNDSHCFFDLWAFEATMTDLEKALNDNQSATIVKLTDRLLKLYQDTFLKNSNSGLAILKQEQLLTKLCHLLDQAIVFHQQHAEHERVCQLLNKGLELRPLQEANYRRLMAYYLHLGQLGQALQIYQQCQRILCKGFNFPLSDEIQSLAEQFAVSSR